MPRQAVIAGRSAAWLYGAADLAGSDDPVEVLVPSRHKFGPVRGLRIRLVDVLWTDEIDESRRTRPVRTALDLARWAPDLTEAVVALDMLLACLALRPGRLAEVAARQPPGRGRAQVQRAVALADARSESPQESRLRMALVRVGLPDPEPQYTVRHGGRFIARVDLAYPAYKIAIEYDGRWHDAPERFGRDRRRLSALAAAGWRVILVTAADLHYPERVVATVRAAMLAAA
jgi:very-short-patch-repair endonuclease